MSDAEDSRHEDALFNPFRAPKPLRILIPSNVGFLYQGVKNFVWAIDHFVEAVSSGKTLAVVVPIPGRCVPADNTGTTPYTVATGCSHLSQASSQAL